MDAISLTFIFQFPPLLFHADRGGIILDYNKTDIVDKKNNALLYDDAVIGNNGGEIFGIGGNLVWDTRDHLFFSNYGSYQYFKILVYPHINDFVFYIFIYGFIFENIFDFIAKLSKFFAESVDRYQRRP